MESLAHRFRPCPNRAFTLIERLVGIAVIAVLAGRQPALVRITARAKSVQCLAGRRWWSRRQAGACERTTRTAFSATAAIRCRRSSTRWPLAPRTLATLSRRP
ncbi:MAG: prepilin-type N-terminal cleavage/methylation domain-containing protein [Verrucomicrobiales bacterium]|nr:prepilin-type N-terminal cleavage/methylation domain-containing protein [Verrucomicrobiales bacterium]MCP5527795.1 prepilin-type N-terminal cleavage/methylation domain-containing protein [Verrucomicrobiales bacterium]